MAVKKALIGSTAVVKGTINGSGADLDGKIEIKIFLTESRFGLIAQKHFKHFTIIANCENLLDSRQTRYENIVIPPTDTPTFRQVYAPLDGQVFNLAIRIKI